MTALTIAIVIGTLVIVGVWVAALALAVRR